MYLSLVETAFFPTECIFIKSLHRDYIYTLITPIVSKYVSCNYANSSLVVRNFESYKEINDISSNLPRFLNVGILVYTSFTNNSTFY